MSARCVDVTQSRLRRHRDCFTPYAANAMRHSRTRHFARARWTGGIKIESRSGVTQALTLGGTFRSFVSAVCAYGDEKKVTKRGDKEVKRRTSRGGFTASIYEELFDVRACAANIDPTYFCQSKLRLSFVYAHNSHTYILYNMRLLHTYTCTQTYAPARKRENTMIIAH